MARKDSDYTNIFVDRKTREELKKLAKEEGRTMKVMIEQLIKYWRFNHDL